MGQFTAVILPTETVYTGRETVGEAKKLIQHPAIGRGTQSAIKVAGGIQQMNAETNPQKMRVTGWQPDRTEFSEREDDTTILPPVCIKAADSSQSPEVTFSTREG